MKIDNEEDVTTHVKDQIRLLEEDSHWQSDNEDFMPLSFANML